jgi:hypothetical protein
MTRSDPLSPSQLAQTSIDDFDFGTPSFAPSLDLDWYNHPQLLAGFDATGVPNTTEGLTFHNIEETPSDTLLGSERGTYVTVSFAHRQIYADIDHTVDRGGDPSTSSVSASACRKKVT